MNTRVIITAEDQTGAGIGAVKASLNGLGSAVGALTPLLSGFASAFSAGAFISFIKGSIDAADAMKDLSERTGLSIRELATWELAAKQSGAGLEAVALGVKNLSKYMVSHSGELQAAGITATTTNGAMLQLADLFQKLPDGALKSALAVKVLGRAGDALIPMLNQGGKGLAETTEKSADYAKRLEELAPKADQFNDQMSELGLQSKAAGMNIANYFLPGLIGMSKWLNDIAGGGEKAQKAVEWMLGERTMKAMVLMGHPMLTGPDKRSSSGKISGGPADLAASNDATERVLAEREAEKTACKAIGGRWDAKTNRCVLGKEGKSGTGRTGAKTPLQKMIELGERNLAASKAAEYVAADDDEEARLGAHKRQMESLKLQEKEADALEKLRKKYVEMADPLEKYRVQLDEINMLRASGKLTADQAIEAEWAVNDAMDKTIAKMGEFKDSGKDAFADLTKAVEGWGNAFTDTLADMVMGGKASFTDLANSILRDMLRMQIKENITSPMMDWGKGLMSSLFQKNADGGVYRSDSLHAYANTVVSSPTLFRFAQGGAFGLMGEAGEEAIMPLARGPNGKLGVQATGGTQQAVVIEVINPPGRPAQAESVTQRIDPRGLVVSVMLGDLATNGPIAQGMAGRFGLRGSAA